MAVEISRATATPEPVASGRRDRRWSQLVLLTAGAVCLYVVIRHLPTGTNLSHMDFRPGAGSIELCDPANPQFVPCASVPSPVTLALAPDEAPVAGRRCDVTCTLTTTSGKSISAVDLLVVHTKKLHMLIIDPSLRDYQHVHPVSLDNRGHWRFSFTPRFNGSYRLFADFTPAATGRGLYATADLAVAEGSPGRPDVASASPASERYRFALDLDRKPVAGKQFGMAFSVTDTKGEPIDLQLIMGTYAHLVAFDPTRSGFAHLHPNESDPAWRPDPRHPRMTFKLTVPTPGPYVVWAQVNLAGQVVSTPFQLQVAPP